MRSAGLFYLHTIYCFPVFVPSFWFNRTTFVPFSFFVPKPNLFFVWADQILRFEMHVIASSMKMGECHAERMLVCQLSWCFSNTSSVWYYSRIMYVNYVYRSCTLGQNLGAYRPYCKLRHGLWEAWTLILRDISGSYFDCARRAAAPREARARENHRLEKPTTARGDYYPRGSLEQ